MQDVSCAKMTLSMFGQKDRFGNDMVNIFHVLWAARVLIWFRNYLNKVREFISVLRMSWNNAVSRVWNLIRIKAIVLPDVP